MAKLSILIDDVDYIRLKRHALDFRLRFQPWVRSAVLALLDTPVNTAPAYPMAYSHQDNELITLLLQIKQRDRKAAEALELLIRTVARGVTIDADQTPATAPASAEDKARQIDTDLDAIARRAGAGDGASARTARATRKP